MIYLENGFRVGISKYFNINEKITVKIEALGEAEYDVCCFGLDKNGKLSDDSYMVFYNQLNSPNREIVQIQGARYNIYKLELSKLPSKIDRLIFTLSIDKDSYMKDLKTISVRIYQNEEFIFNITGEHFNRVKGVILFEVYRRNGEWKISAISGGFNGGLADLLTYYGGEEVKEDTVKQEEVSIQRVSLEKRLEEKAPQLVSLAKPLKISLEKNNLLNVKAQVVLLMDISGSMGRNFTSGMVQRVVNKVVPLAMEFDDNEEFDFIYFGTKEAVMPNVTLDNYKNATDNWRDARKISGGGTNLAAPIKFIEDKFKDSKLPVFVLCITDGATEQEGKVKKMIFENAKYPIFWQFIGVGGGRGYGILNTLDNLKGRVVDNANFFVLDDIDTIDNVELYTRILNEFPKWLKEVKRLGGLQGRFSAVLQGERIME